MIGRARLPLLQLQSPRQRRQKTAWWLLAELGGAPSEGAIVDSSSFPSIKEPRFIEPVGLFNNKVNVEDLWRLIFNRRGPAHTQPKYFAPNGGEVVNLSGLAEHKAANGMMK